MQNGGREKSHECKVPGARGAKLKPGQIFITIFFLRGTSWQIALRKIYFSGLPQDGGAVTQNHSLTGQENGRRCTKGTIKFYEHI